MKNKIDELAKQGILNDKNIHQFLKSEFPTRTERLSFIKECLKKISTRRMLLRAHWYTEIADDQSSIRESRPALNLIFLMAMAEAIAKKRTNNKNLGSLEAIKCFFEYISNEDKNFLRRNFRRTLLGAKYHDLRFSSVLRILYDVRNRAVHGENYYSFSLLDRKSKLSHKHYSSFSLISSGYLGPSKRKRRVSLDIKLTYEELRDVFRRTALANIKSCF